MSKIKPAPNGESIESLHDRVAYALNGIVESLDEDKAQPKAVLLSTHAAVIIAIGRVLTGNMPEDFTEEDFRCGTCCLSKYVRRRNGKNNETVGEWTETQPETIPVIDWKNGNGVKGGWDCQLNGDCSFLTGGEERTW